MPQGVDATLDEAIAAGYMTGAADYSALLAATDLVVDGKGRLIIDKDLKTAGYAGEVHVKNGSRLQLRISGALGDTVHGTFVEDGATLETWTDGAANTLNFLGEPLSFAGIGVDGDGALVSLTTANQQRRGAWGGTVMTMTGDAMVHLKGETGSFDFPYQYAHANNSLDMNGHTLTFCGPYGSGSSTVTIPLRLNIANPGHIVVSNGLYVSINADNNFRGSSDNTFTIADSVSRLDLYSANTQGAIPWTLVLAPKVRRNVLLSSSGGGRWDGPIVWQGSSVPFFAPKAADGNTNLVFGGAVSFGTGLEVTNATGAANRSLYMPVLSFNGKGNSIGGTLKVSDMPASFIEPAPSLRGVEIVNAKMSVNMHGIAGLWKGINQDYLSWNNTSAPSETRCREDFWNNYKERNPPDWTFYTNSVAFGPDDAMNATKPNYGKPTLVTYHGYIWNTGGNRVITFLTQVSGYVRVVVEREAGIWNGPLVYDVNAASKPTGVRLSSNGAYKIAIVLALHDGNGGANGAIGGGGGIMYCWGSSTSESTDPNDYMPLMDPGDGSLFTRYAPGTAEYDALGVYGTEPFKVADAVTGDASSTLSLGGGNYCVGAVTGAVTVLNAAAQHTENAAFTVADELHCRAADLVAGEHLTVTGALKFAEGSVLSFSGTKSFPDCGTYVAAESTETIVGVPAIAPGAQSRFKMKVYASPSDGRKLMVDVALKGTVVFFR